MDRTKEELKEEEQDEEQKQSMDKSSKVILTPLITTHTTTNILAAANTDDDTSTESSDTFDTWTLVSDKQKFIEPHVNDDDSRIEILKNSEPDEDEFEENERKTAEQQQLQDSLKDVTNDDFSDGISIISESESVGRLTPHPYVRGHLQDLNLEFSTNHNMDDDILYRLRHETPIKLANDPEEQQLRHRRRSSATVDAIKEEQALQRSFQTVSLPLDVPPFVKRSLQGIFYIGVGLAILALIGKIVNPTWPLAGVKQSAVHSADLEQKVYDMELQNNLMRAEIDLLNKQVKYLNSFKDPQQQQQQQQYKGKYKEGKTFKAWSGNGDSLKPVLISKEDLKRPYKCPDGSYVEIANMCMEQRPQNEPSLVDQFGHVIEDLKQQSETFKTFEKVAEELHGFQDNPFEQMEKILTEDNTAQAQPKPTTEFINNKPTPPTNEFPKNKPVYPTTDDFKQKYQHHHKEFEKSKPNAESKHHHMSPEGQHSFGKDNKAGKNENPSINQESFENFQDNLKEKMEKLKENIFKFTGNSKESFEKFQDDSKKTLEKLRNQSKESFEKMRDNSKEKFKKMRDDSRETFKKLRDDSREIIKKIRDNSKEEFQKFKDSAKYQGNFKEKQAGKRFEDSQESKEKSSKERRHKRQSNVDGNNNDNSKESGEWQEKYMQHREKQRKQNEQKYQKNNENWYIKRGDSRENKRSGEKQFR